MKLDVWVLATKWMNVLLPNSSNCETLMIDLEIQVHLFLVVSPQRAEHCCPVSSAGLPWAGRIWDSCIPVSGFLLKNVILALICFMHWMSSAAQKLLNGQLPITDTQLMMHEWEKWDLCLLFGFSVWTKSKCVNFHNIEQVSAPAFWGKEFPNHSVE